MEFEIWWLLGIPVFFGLGWIAARVDIKQLVSESRSLPRGYFKGLNFLLNEQPDKAIDAFIEIVKLDPETADMHFALGNLFRRRGETERAIRVHQNLLARPDLPIEQQVHAQYELGQDYLKAGLLDRAEETFNRWSTRSTRCRRGAPCWKSTSAKRNGSRAIEAARGPAGIRAPAPGKRKSPSSIASWPRTHWCASTRTHAMALLDKALHADRKNVRATMLMGDVLAGPGRCRRRAADLAPRRAAKRAARGAGGAAPDGWLPHGRPAAGRRQPAASYLAEASSIDLLEVVFKAVIELDGVDAAKQLVQRRTAPHPDPARPGQAAGSAPDEHAAGNAVTNCRWCKNLVHGYTAEAGALPVQPLRLQGAPVLLAMPRLQPAGKPIRRAVPKN